VRAIVKEMKGDPTKVEALYFTSFVLGNFLSCEVFRMIRILNDGEVQI